MKTFLKENWYKLMIGSSMIMTSFGFMIYAISPSYANNNLSKQNIGQNIDGKGYGQFDFLIDDENQIWYRDRNASYRDWFYLKTVKNY